MAISPAQKRYCKPGILLIPIFGHCPIGRFFRSIFVKKISTFLKE
jgi:hypothetical protein